MTIYASGEFTFEGLSNKVSKYARVSQDTSPEDLYGLMKGEWNLRLPTLLLSVTGGAKDFVMKPRLKNLFSKGLVRAVETTGAWIITGGTHAGVMKHVGEAVRDFTKRRHFYAENEEIVVLGIAPWGVVYNTDSLSSKEPDLPAEYAADEENQGRLCCLDPYHTHFILVDDGSQGKYGVEIALRTCLEKFISEQTMSKGEVHIKIPVACVCLEGGKGSLDTVHQSMANNTPCVIVEGSGRVADVIAQAANCNASEITTSLIRDKLRLLFNDPFTENMIIEWTQKIRDIVTTRQLLTIFSLESDGTNDIDVAILEALLKACQSLGYENWNYQLTLAVCWNRLQVAKDIFHSEWQREAKDLYPVMTLALIEDKPNFVRLFLNQGILLREYVTLDTLTSLYNNVEPSSLVYSKMKKFLKEDELPPNLKDAQLHVSKILKKLLGRSHRTCLDISQTAKQVLQDEDEGCCKNTKHKETTTTDFRLPMYISETLEYPIRDLLIWAILQNRLGLAEIIWSKSQDCINGALACCMILKKSAKEEEDMETSEEILAQADHYEELAMGVLSECCKEHEEQAETLLTHTSFVWGKSTCLHMALNASALNFMSHGGVQMLLTKVWWGKLSVDNSVFNVLLCMLFFPLLFTGLVTFRTETSPPNKKTKPSAMNGCQRLAAFFTAPVVVFYWNVISYIGFLWLFAYVLMMDFQTLPSWRECTLYAWVFTIFCEELRQSFYDPDGVGFGKKCKLYIMSFWNKVDALGLLLFLAGFICRILRPTFYAGKVIFSLDFGIFCFRLMHIFAVSKILGPKIIMMWKMIKDTFSFLFLLVVWIASFGVSKQAITVHNEAHFNWILWNVIYKPYLTIFGDIPSDVYGGSLLSCVDFNCTTVGSTGTWKRERNVKPTSYSHASPLGPHIGEKGGSGQEPVNILEVSTCNKKNVKQAQKLNLTECSPTGKDPTMSKCPYHDRSGNSLFPEWLTIILLCLYLLFANILLVNLLIAMFSYTFAEVQGNTAQVWRFQRHSLIEEYCSRPPAPPPFIIFSHLYCLLKYVVLCCPPTENKQLMCRLEEHENQALLAWEAECRDEYLLSQLREKKQSTEQKTRDTYDNIQQKNGSWKGYRYLIHNQTTSKKFGPKTPDTTYIVASIELVEKVLKLLETENKNHVRRTEERLTVMEDQMSQVSEALNWIMKAMAEKGLGTEDRPPLSDPRKSSKED